MNVIGEGQCVTVCATSAAWGRWITGVLEDQLKGEDEVRDLDEWDRTVLMVLLRRLRNKIMR